MESEIVLWGNKRADVHSILGYQNKLICRRHLEGLLALFIVKFLQRESQDDFYTQDSDEKGSGKRRHNFFHDVSF
jgi:hypothetical protein